MSLGTFVVVVVYCVKAASELTARPKTNPAYQTKLNEAKARVEVHAMSQSKVAQLVVASLCRRVSFCQARSHAH